MTERIVKSVYFGQLMDKILPILTWIIITLPLWLSPFHPAVVAYLIISFDLYFFYKSIRTTYLATVSYLKILKFSKIDFTKKIKKFPNASILTHFIIIPNYKEPLTKLEATIKSICNNDYPFHQLYLVLAFELRETEAKEKANQLINTFKDKFNDILVCYHPLIEKEAPGKASNQSFAAKAVENYANNHNLDYKKIIITICDADSLLSKNYFSYLTHDFITDTDRLYHFYWAPVLLYNNFWQLPFFLRVQATLSSIVRLAFLGQKENLIQISTYSTNLWLLKQVDYWDVDIIPEDWHIYLQCFFKFGDKIKTLPIYSIINGDAVYSGGLIKTFVNRYEQEKRWAWGVTDIGYSFRKFFTTPHIPIMAKVKKIWFIAENHLLWPISFFMLTISAWIPPLISPFFKRTVLGFLLPKLSALILTMSSLLLVMYIYLDIKLRQKVNLKTKINYLPLLFVQWYFLPVISFFFSSLPALEAHTRLLFGKKIKYKVTEKV